jgi:hypothetical protein
MHKSILGILMAILVIGIATAGTAVADNKVINTDKAVIKKVNGDVTVNVNGAPGAAGQDGIDGQDGQDGVNGAPGVNGTNGVDGKDGINGTNGVDGRDGVDGKDGVNGTNGVDGKDGVNGTTLSAEQIHAVSFVAENMGIFHDILDLYNNGSLSSVNVILDNGTEVPGPIVNDTMPMPEPVVNDTGPVEPTIDNSTGNNGTAADPEPQPIE